MIRKVKQGGVSLTFWFISLYFILVSFTKAVYLPVFYAKIQPAELIFICFGIPLLIHYRLEILRWFLTFPKSILISISFYVLTNLVSGVMSANLDGVLESLGRSYLVLVFILVAFLVSRNSMEGVAMIRKYWMLGVLILCGLTLTGYILAQLGWINETVRVFDHYPYFGTIIRTAGLTGGSGMLVMVSMIMALDAWWRWRTGEGPFWPVFLIGIVLALTFSKELVLIGLGIFLIDPRWLNINRKIKGAIVMLMAGFFWLGTHVIVTTNLKATQDELEGTVYSSRKILGSCGEWTFIESSYLALKRAGMFVGMHHPILGVGPGRFNHAIQEAKTAGVYPEFLPDYDPHSTWVGAFSETGILGLVSLVMMVLGLGFFFSSRKKIGMGHPFQRILLVGLLLHLIASVSVDAMNFRHIWLSFGILVGMMIPVRSTN